MRSSFRCAATPRLVFQVPIRLSGCWQHQPCSGTSDRRVLLQAWRGISNLTLHLNKTELLSWQGLYGVGGTRAPTMPMASAGEDEGPPTSLEPELHEDGDAGGE